MSNIVQLSEAASLGIHAMVIIARSNKIINANTIAEMTDASRNHLAKVMLTLAKMGLVKSLRGPSGGFVLAKKTGGHQID
jgi:Rrf2 family protein